MYGRRRRLTLVATGCGAVVLFAGSLLAAINARGLGICDDAFIAFRVARNLAEGHGLSFNPGGPPVEAASSFVLTAALAAAHRAGVSIIGSALAIGQVAVVLVCLLLAWRLQSTVGLAGIWAPFALAASSVTARNATSGLETTLVALLLLGAVSLYLHAERRARPDRRSLALCSVLLALVAMTRPEGPIYLLALSGLRAAALLTRWRRRQALDLGSELVWIGAFAAIYFPYTIFRVWHFGELLPNTYHAKNIWFATTTAKLEAGWLYLKVCAVIEPLLPLSLLAGLWLLAINPSRRIVVLLVLIAAQVAFIVGSGGDWPHMFGYARFFFPVMPLSLWLLAEAGLRLIRLRRRAAALVAATSVLALSQVDFVELTRSRLDLPPHYLVDGSERALTRKALRWTYGEALFRLPFDEWLSRSLSTYSLARYHNNFDAAAGLWLRQRYGPATRIASIQAGQFAFWADLPFFDMFGIGTPAVARARVDDPERLTELLREFDPHLIAFYKWGDGGVHHQELVRSGFLGERGYGLRYVLQRKTDRAFVVFEKNHRASETAEQLLFGRMDELPWLIEADRWIPLIDPNRPYLARLGH